jgi:hypothetical protein
MQIWLLVLVGPCPLGDNFTHFCGLLFRHFLTSTLGSLLLVPLYLKVGRRPVMLGSMLVVS